MKKLKIFLLLSILLCFGFVLCSEVHAQSNGNHPYIGINTTSWSEEPSYPTNVVVFKSDSPRTITPKFTQSGVTLQYSIDNGSTWNNISSGVTTASSDEIWFRGRATGAKSLYTSDSNSNTWVFSGDASNKLHVYGDLRYLLCNNLGDNTITFNIASYCFSYMFYGCTSLTTAPSLPVTTLADYCYDSMFRNCTSLTTAPSLPATTLVDFCYYMMFRNCTSLTTAPSLPATTLADYCYNSMFRGCTAFRVSTTKTGSYQHAWRIPTSGEGTTASNWNTYMLLDTGGTFTGNPTINTTYYVENPPVEDLNPPSGYTISFNSNGGTTIPDVEDATELPTLPTPTKFGYSFLGWYYDDEFFTEAFTGDPLTGDVTLYAKWGEKNKMTDITILIIGLIIFIIANILGFIYKNNLLTALSGLLWLLPIFLVDNMIIKIFSVIIMLITFLFSFKERDDYYYD